MGKWIHCQSPVDDPKVRLFCFPHAGGSGYEYQKWAGLEGMDHIEVKPLEQCTRGRCTDAMSRSVQCNGASKHSRWRVQSLLSAHVLLLSLLQVLINMTHLLVHCTGSLYYTGWTWSSAGRETGHNYERDGGRNRESDEVRMCMQCILL